MPINDLSFCRTSVRLLGVGFKPGGEAKVSEWMEFGWVIVYIIAMYAPNEWPNKWNLVRFNDCVNVWSLVISQDSLYCKVLLKKKVMSSQ